MMRPLYLWKRHVAVVSGVAALCILFNSSSHLHASISKSKRATTVGGKTRSVSGTSANQANRKKNVVKKGSIYPVSKSRPAKPKVTKATNKTAEVFKPLLFGPPMSGVDLTTGIKIDNQFPWPGLLSYSYFVVGEFPSRSWFGLYDTSEQSGDKQESTSQSNFNSGLKRLYRALKYKGSEDDGILFNPQFSPDGRYVLLKYGGGWNVDPYSLYVMTVETGTLKRLKPRPTNIFTKWSPDSNYIAYIQGGTQNGDVNTEQGYYGPLQLHMLNWRTGEDRLIVSNDTLWQSFSWKPPHTLLYGVLSSQGSEILRQQEQIQEARQKALAKGQEGARQLLDIEKLPAPQPDIFGYSFESKTSRLMFRDGYRPLSSPDGKWVAFFGSEDPKKPAPLRNGWEVNPSGASLSIARADGSNRRALNLQPSYGQLLWRKDSQHLLSIQEQENSASAWLTIYEWDINTGNGGQVAAYQVLEKKTPYDRFVLSSVQLSEKGDEVFVLTKNFLSRPSQRFSDVVHTLASVNLHNGSSRSLVRFNATNKNGKNIGSYVDWIEKPLP